MACFAAATTTAQGAPAAAVPARDFAVRCGTLLVGDGTAPLHDTWLIVRGGKVHAVGSSEAPADLPIVDAAARVVMPGIVAVDSDLANADDSEYQVAPDALAVDSFDFERKWLEALQGGVTTAYLSPGRSRLVSGQGAVVKLAGRDIVERVLTENACPRVNLGDGAMQAPRVFEPVPHPTDDDPLLRRYAGEAFVEVMPAGSHPETRLVRASNLCRIAVHRPQGGDTVVVLSVIDNLVKGAAGQAVQNLNIMFGFDEETGLDIVPVSP